MTCEPRRHCAAPRASAAAVPPAAGGPGSGRAAGRGCAGMRMTEGAHFLAVKPLSVKTTRASCADAVILNVMRHNARELQAEIGVGADSGIDASRIHLNVTLHGPATADGVASAARDAMREHGIVAPRKNATLGIEIVASLPAGLLIDHLAYFRDTAAWAQQHYRVPLLSAIVHNDESSPHLHLVLLPVRDGKLVGSELLGNRATMKAMQKDFHEQVAKQYGLRMPAAKKRHTAAQRAAGIVLLRDTLQANSGLTDHAISALLIPHAKNPEPLLVALGLAMPAPVVKGSFVATMTRKVRPESPDRMYKKSPIGHLHAQTADDVLPEKANSYALLGDCISPPNSPSLTSPSSTTDSTHGQQASSSSAARQATGGQQRERSTTGAAVPAPGLEGSDEMASQHTAGDILNFEDIATAGALSTAGTLPPGAGQRQASTGVQNILHIPLVASTNPVADQGQPAERLGKNNETFSLPTAGTVTSTGASPHKRSTKPPVAAAGRPAAKRATGAALTVDHGEQHDQVHGQRAGQHLGAPVHASARTPENSPRGDAGPVATAAAPARNASTGKNGPDPLPIVPGAPVGSSAGKGKRTAPKVGSASTAPRQPASTHGPENVGARPPSPVTSSADQVGQAVTTRKRNAKTAGAKVATTTAAKPAGPRCSAGGVQSLHPIASDASSTPAKRRPASSSSATPADEVATCAPLKVSSSMDDTKAAAPGPSSTSTAAARTAAPARQERVTAVKPGKSRNKSQVPGDEKLSTTSSHDLGESPNAQDVDQPDEIRWLGAGAGPLSPSSENRTKPASMPAQAPPIGGPWDGAGLLDLGGDPQPDDEAGDYQRHRDDDRAAEHWDEQRGEFVTAPATPTKRHATPRWPGPDRLCDGWQEARPSVVEAALASVRAACGWLGG